MIEWYQRMQQWCLDHLVLQPTKEPLERGNQVSASIVLDPSTLGERLVRIESCVYSCLGEEPLDWLCIKFPGTGGRAERSTPFPTNLRSAGDPNLRVETWTWNPPGYGNSPGRTRLKELPEIATLWTREVLDRRLGKDTQIWFVGNSLGCLSAMNAAIDMSQRLANPVGLWLRNPPELQRVIPHVGQRWRVGKVLAHMCRSLPNSVSSIHLASQCNLPAVFLMSELDELVPPWIQALIHEAYQGEKKVVVLKEQGHAGLIDENHLEAISQACDWLWGKAIQS